MRKILNVAFCLIAAHLWGGSYTLVDLGRGFAAGINASGQVIGNSDTTGTAYIYQNGVFHYYPSPNQSNNTARGIADNGDFVSWGYLTNIQGDLYSGGSYHFVGTLPGDIYSFANGVNSSDQVVGYSTSGSGAHAFLYSNGVMQDLGTLGGTAAFAGAINNAGQITGTGFDANGTPSAFLYQNGVMTSLGILPNGGGSYGQGISANGMVTGYSLAGGPGYHAFRYENGVMQDLGTPSDSTYAQGYGVNDSGMVVGFDLTPEFTNVAYLYDGSSWINLNNFIGGSDLALLRDAFAINNAGQIVGDAIGLDGFSHGFLLTPTSDSASVPEPATLLMFGAGMLGIARRLRRRFV